MEPGSFSIFACPFVRMQHFSQMGFSGDDVGSVYVWEFHRLPNVLGKRGGMSTFSVGLLEGSHVHIIMMP